MTNIFASCFESDPAIEAKRHKPRIVFYADTMISETNDHNNVAFVDYWRDGTDNGPASEWIVPGTA